MKSILEVLFGVFTFLVDLIHIRKIRKEEKRHKKKLPFKKYLLQPSMVAVYILIVLAIVSALVVNFIRTNHTLPNQAKNEMSEISQALHDWSKKFGSFPKSLDMLIGQNPLRREWSRDVWENQYIYVQDSSNSSFMLTSLGPDRISSKDDIVVTNLTKSH